MTAFAKLLEIIDRLETQHIPYYLSHAREDAIMIRSHPPGHWWEIEVFSTGEIEIEVFTSPGHIYDETKLPEFFDLWTNDEST